MYVCLFVCDMTSVPGLRSVSPFRLHPSVRLQNRPALSPAEVINVTLDLVGVASRNKIAYR